MKSNADVLGPWFLSLGPTWSGRTTGASLYLVLSGASCRAERLCGVCSPREAFLELEHPCFLLQALVACFVKLIRVSGPMLSSHIVRVAALGSTDRGHLSMAGNISVALIWNPPNLCQCYGYLCSDFWADRLSGSVRGALVSQWPSLSVL